MRSKLLYNSLLVWVFVVGFSALAGGQTQVVEKQGNWVLENELLRVTVDPNAGKISVLEKRRDRLWEQPPAGVGSSGPVFRNVRKASDQKLGLAFEGDFGTSAGKPNTLTVILSLSETAADLLVEADMTQRQQKVENIPFLEPFVLDSQDAVLVVADYSDGHLYPLDLNPFPRNWLSVSRLDMPWVGVCGLKKGYGYSIIVETPDDAYIQMQKVRTGQREISLPRVGWIPCKKNFTYARRLIYHFSPAGGYVALAKCYRSYAQKQGLVVPFAEKLKKNPNIARLLGAVDVWGDASLKFAQEAKAAGVDKMIIHGRSSPDEMKAINELGYLTSEYDNYTDVLPLDPGKEVDSQHDRIPENVVLKDDGQRMTAWLTFDKKQQFMKRCPAFWVTSAKVVIPKVLATHPYLGRFIDVTTAEDLYECYDPNHPLSRGDKRNCGVELLSYVRSLGLVTGGEHGLWWAVPHLDYIEGMMSGGWSYPWPAGHLIRPKSKDEQFTSPWGGKYGSWEEYSKWSIGHEYRVPLWELVFHDCIVSTWYWGDASDFLLSAAPEVTAKKDAFNILYGTIPLMWANREGSWHTHREIFLGTCRNTCKLHEAIAGAEMLNHEFVTADRGVQRTLFSDGTEVIVNFSPQPYAAELAGKKYLLPENGFAVKGPRIEQSLALIGGQPVTTIRYGDYYYSDHLKDAHALPGE